jgi:hypothetical protein
MLKSKLLSLLYSAKFSLSTIITRFPQNTNKVEKWKKFLIRNERLAL